MLPPGPLQLLPVHPLLFTTLSINIILLLTDPLELGKVETNTKTQPMQHRLYNLCETKKLSLQAKPS